MIKQRFLGLALSLAIIATFGYSLTTRAADTQTVTLDANVADVLILSVNTNGFSFGTDLNFLGDNANYGNCPQSPGARYLGPNVTTTVWSNRVYDLDRSGAGNFPVGRIFVREHSGFTSCPDTGNGIPLVAGPVTTVDDHAAASGAQDTEFFFFDVHVDDPANVYSAVVTYQAIAQP